jgi:hypothetical protein
MNIAKHHLYGEFPEKHLRSFLKASEDAWKISSIWNNTDLQPNIERKILDFDLASSVQANVPLIKLGVSESRAEIDIVVHSDIKDKRHDLFLLQLSGHQTPRHEKELLGIMSVSLNNYDLCCFGILVVCTDNHLRLEGRANSFNYCKGPLVRLAKSSLIASHLKGLLIIGLPTPSRNKA